MKTKNRVVESFENDLESDLDPELDSMEDGLDFDPNDPEEQGMSDEELIEHASQMSDAQTEALQRSRKRGKAPRAGARSRVTAAQEDARGRNPRREREFEWRPQNTLDAPPPRPGMEQRWIRYQLNAANDPQNWSRQKRQHWTPRKLDTVTEEFSPPTTEVAGLGSVISVGDLILCERPAYIGQSRRRFFAKKLQRQLAAAKRKITGVQDPDNPIMMVDRADLPPTVGIGRRVRAQDDE